MSKRCCSLAVESGSGVGGIRPDERGGQRGIEEQDAMRHDVVHQHMRIGERTRRGDAGERLH